MSSVDNKALEFRLLTNDSVLSSASVTRCAAKLQALRDQTNNKTGIEAFLREILLLKLDVDKSHRIYDAWTAQNREYDSLEEDITTEIVDAKANIQYLELSLKNELEIRTHRSLCEDLACKVNKLPSRSMLKRKIETNGDELCHTNELLSLVELEIFERRRQFDKLLECIADLQTNRPQEEKGFQFIGEMEEVEEEEDDEEEAADGEKNISNEGDDETGDDFNIAEKDLVEDVFMVVDGGNDQIANVNE